MISQKTEGKKLKILFVSRDKYPPFRPDVSVLFGKELVGRGHSVDFILQSSAPCRRSHQTVWSCCKVWVGRNVDTVSFVARVRKNLYDLVHDLNMIKLMFKKKYDIIQVKDKTLAALVAVLVAKLRRIRFFYWLSYPYAEASVYKFRNGSARYPFVYFFRGHFCKYLLYKLIMPSAIHIFVQSEQMKRDVEAMGIRGDKLTPVPMGVSLDMLRDLNMSFKPKNSEKDRIVAYLGTLEKVRRMDFLIRVMSKVLNAVPNTKLVLIGDGNDPEDQEVLRRESTKLGIQEYVEITGFLPRELALQYIDRANICVSPFYPTPILNSTSPTKLVEYMAMGKPVVANDHPEQRLVIADSGGGLCVPYDETAFANAIIYLLNNPNLAEDMGVRARSYVELNRDYRNIANLVEKRYFAFLI